MYFRNSYMIKVDIHMQEHIQPDGMKLRKLLTVMVVDVLFYTLRTLFCPVLELKSRYTTHILRWTRGNLYQHLRCT